jgi:7,8-dihydro-6-hydroxymethylpterin-pyrophosphokinase
MLVRRFVLAPLAEIAPEVKHPLWSGTASKMLARLADKSQVRRIDSAK